MLRKLAVFFSVFLFAFGILLTSVFRTAAVKYEFAPMTRADETRVLGEDTVEIEYYLAFPGKVLPDSPFWSLKALRDRVWLFFTTNPSRRAELKLLFADKRISMSKLLFEKGEPEVGYSTLTKAGKYLEEASNQEKENRIKGIDTFEFLRQISQASLKHFQVMDELINIAPEDAKPGIAQTQTYARSAYEEARNALLEKGQEPPENPFDWN